MKYGLSAVTYFCKNFMLDVWKSSEYASVVQNSASFDKKLFFALKISLFSNYDLQLTIHVLILFLHALLI